MAIVTDFIEASTLTGFARAALADQEGNSLAAFLPNREVNDYVVRLAKGATGLSEVAEYRAFDAEPGLTGAAKLSRVTVDLPAVSQKQFISEQDILNARRLGDPSAAERLVQEAVISVVKNIADRVEWTRGIVLETGKATIDNNRFSFDADFGRPASNTVTAATLWSDSSAKVLDDLMNWVDVYRDGEGTEASPGAGANPGTFLMSTQTLRLIARSGQFAQRLGALATDPTRPASLAEINGILAGAGLPGISLYDRKVWSRNDAGQRVRQNVISANKVLLLPAPVDANGSSELGATFWGATATASQPEFALQASELPGVVAAVNKSGDVPAQTFVAADALNLPVLANAELSFAATVA